MKITSSNFNSITIDAFYKATASGVQVCYTVRDWQVGEPQLEGYVVDSLFHKIQHAPNGIAVLADISHLDNPNQGFFTTEEEAIALHRELVLNYIRGLNASSLKTCPIDISTEGLIPKLEYNAD